MLHTARHALAWTALAVLGLAGPVSAGDGAVITSHDGSTITTGTVITINGTFAPKGTSPLPKPKVFGTIEASKKKIALKVLTHTETEITAEVKKIPSSKKAPAAGSNWVLHVQPRGKGALAEATSASLMTVVAPTITSVTGGSVMPGELFSVQVTNPGSKPIKASVGGKKAKLKPMPDLEEGGGSMFVGKVPKSLANGSWDVVVSNKLGSDTSSGSLTVTGSTKKIGKAKFTAMIDGQSYATGGKFLGAQMAGGNVVVVAAKGNSPSQSFQMTIPFNVATDSTPVTYTHFPATGLLFNYIVTTLQGGGFPDIQTWSGAGPNANMSLTINASSSGQLAGSFTGTVFNGAQKSSRQVSGNFIVDL